MKTPVRCSFETLLVLRQLLINRDVEQSGADLVRKCELKAGTVYTILYRLEQHRLIQGRWEKVDPHLIGRPRMHLYQITADGENLLRQALDMLCLPKSC